MDFVPIAIFWALVVWALASRKPVLVYLFFGSMPFGSFAVVPTAVTAGLTLTPTPMVALLLIVRQLFDARGAAWAIGTALRPSGLLLLFLFWIVAVFVTLFMPRYFAGLDIVPLKVTQFMSVESLGPTMQNLSQLIYLSISVLAVFAFARLLGQARMRTHVVGAISLGAAITVATGLLDAASQYVPLQPLLEPFRTASYALLTDVEMEGAKRVVGLMPEASSFGNLAVGFLSLLYFFRRTMAPGLLRDRLAPGLLALLVAMIWISTSSAAYLGLFIFACVAVAEWLWRAAWVRDNAYLTRGLGPEFWIVALGMSALILVAMLAPGVLQPVIEAVDLLVFRKSETSSFEERGMWTTLSWEALLATHGLGTGLGGTRASNFAVALTSNVGFLGAGLYFLFVLQSLLLRRAPAQDKQGQAFLNAARWSWLAPFVSSLMIGTTPDFGLLNAFLYGFALAIAQPPAVARAQAYPAWTPAATALPRAPHGTP